VFRGGALFLLLVLGGCEALELDALRVVAREDSGAEDVAAPRPGLDLDAATDEPAAPDASVPGDAEAPSGVASLETAFLDLGTHIIGSETPGQIMVRGDPTARARIRVVRVEGHAGLTLDEARVGDVLRIEPSSSMSIGIVFRAASHGEKEFRVVLDLCDAGCFAEAMIVADVPETRPIDCFVAYLRDVPVGDCVTTPLSCRSMVDDDLDLSNGVDSAEISLRIWSSFVRARGEPDLGATYCPVDAGDDSGPVFLDVRARSAYSSLTTHVELWVVGYTPASD
jgi:hypothetical protein